MYKVIEHGGKKYFTFYKLTEMEVGQTIFLFIKIPDIIVKTKLIAMPVDFTDMHSLFGNEEFVFETDDGNIIKVSKRYDSGSFFYTNIPKQKTSRHKISKVIFLTDTQHKYSHYPDKRLIGLSKHRSEVLGKMKVGVPYSASELGTRNRSMERLRDSNFVKEVETKIIKGKEVRYFQKEIVKTLI